MLKLYAVKVWRTPGDRSYPAAMDTRSRVRRWNLPLCHLQRVSRSVCRQASETRTLAHRHPYLLAFTDLLPHQRQRGLGTSATIGSN
jgi:hypothetical protein